MAKTLDGLLDGLRGSRGLGLQAREGNGRGRSSGGAWSSGGACASKGSWLGRGIILAGMGWWISNWAIGFPEAF